MGRFVFHALSVIVCLLIAGIAIGLLVPAFLVWFAAWVDRENLAYDFKLWRSRRLLRRHLKAMGA